MNNAPHTRYAVKATLGGSVMTPPPSAKHSGHAQLRQPRGINGKTIGSYTGKAQDVLVTYADGTTKIKQVSEFSKRKASSKGQARSSEAARIINEQQAARISKLAAINTFGYDDTL